MVANVLWRNDQTILITIKYAPLSYQTGRNRKLSKQSMKVDQKSLETLFRLPFDVSQAVNHIKKLCL